MWWFLYTVAAAEIPEGLEPAVSPDDIQAQYVAHRQKTGQSPKTLACRSLWEDAARLCFRVVVEGKRRWVTTSDLASWKTDLAALEAAVKSEAADFLSTELERKTVEDMPGTYVQLRDGHGRTALAVLHPELLEAEVGRPLALAMPSTGVLLAWKAGDADHDKVMAVAVSELHQQARDPVTAVVHRLDKDGWVPFVEATPE